MNHRALRQPPAAEIAILAVAALTRFWQLSRHSIWFDEAVSLAWAGSDPGFIWRATFPLVEDKHPPLYYLTLHGWRQLMAPFGLYRSDVALRSFGSLLGVLGVLGLLLLAGRLSGRRVGLLAGALAALSPILVWYSQELRMFQPAAAALIWAGYCQLRAWEGCTPRARFGWWVGFVISLVAALYSYLFSAFLLPAAGLTIFLLLFTGDVCPSAAQTAAGRRRFAEGSAALLAAALLFLPLAANAWSVNAAEGKPGRAFEDAARTTLHLLQVFTVWRPGWPPLLEAASAAVFGLLIAAGLLLRRRDGRDGAGRLCDRLWLLIWLGTPLLIANLLLSRSDAIFAEDRYLLFLAPFVLWAAARGAVAAGERWRPAGVLAALLLLALLAASLPRLWTSAFARENWRAAAGYVVDYERRSPGLPGVVVTHVDYTRRPFEWYARRSLGREELPVFFPFGGALSADAVEEVVAPPLDGIVESGAATLWLTESHLDGVDDGRVVAGWLGEHFPLVTEQFPAGIRLTGYALRSRFPALPPLTEGAVRPAVELAPGLTLAACEVLTPAVQAADDAMHPPSGWVHVRLWWTASGSIEDDYQATVRMVGPEGVWGDRLVRENEAFRRWPTNTWPAGEFIRDEIDVNLNPVTPSGRYPIVVGLLDSAGQPAGSLVECGQVAIE